MNNADNHEYMAENDTPVLGCSTQIVGGCCNSGTCTIETQADCVGSSGNYLGDSTSCSPDPAGNPTTYSASPGASITDNQSTSDTITVPASGSVTIGNVNVSVDISHTYVRDLIITIAHLGITATLFSRACRNEDDIIATFDDGGTALDCSDLASSLSFLPAQALSVFDSLNSSGDWTVTITDNAKKDSGTFNSWQLIIDGQGLSPCATSGTATSTSTSTTVGTVSTIRCNCLSTLKN